MQIDISKTWCFTGHRPNKLYGYDRNNAGNLQLCFAIRDAVKYLHLTHGIDTFISGMALGWDIWAALEVLELKETYPIKLICAIPCKDHSNKFSQQDKYDYDYFQDIIFNLHEKDLVIGTGGDMMLNYIQTDRIKIDEFFIDRRKYSWEKIISPILTSLFMPVIVSIITTLIATFIMTHK
jgi:uncharacterized phage-like protein YoqJ